MLCCFLWADKVALHIIPGHYNFFHLQFSIPMKHRQIKTTPKCQKGTQTNQWCSIGFAMVLGGKTKTQSQPTNNEQKQ
jgi:hypothetical protein